MTVSAAEEVDDDGLRYESSVAYRLSPDDEAVHVSIDISVTNELPDDGGGYYYFDEVWVPVLSEASDIRAERAGGGRLSTRLEETEDPLWSTLVISLSRELLYRQTQDISLTYVLPDQPPRGDGWTRANAAYAEFPVYPIGDPGISDVEVVIPAGYEVETAGSELTREAGEDDAAVFRATEIADPDVWWATLVARNDALLEERQVTIGDDDVILRHWPGDGEWGDFVTDHTTKGIPVLEDLIGRPWPVSGELEIIETSTPHLYGFGGWYDPAEDLIEIGDELDPALIMHELSHAWFNDELSSELWLLEGLAEEYAARAVEAVGGEPPELPSVSADDPGAQPLLQWEQEQSTSGEVDEHQEYGYRASRWVVSQLVSDVGPETMAEIIGAAADDDIPYQGDVDPETVSGSADWRRLLDLLEEIGGSEVAQGVFTTHVLTGAEIELLDERNAAREVYAGLVEAGEGWTAPLAVRTAMSGWEFDEVGALTEAATGVLATRDAALADLADVGVDALPALEHAYETAGDLSALDTEARRYQEVASTIADAEAPSGGIAGAFAGLGLVTADLDGLRDDAAAALGDGNLAAAEERSAEATELADYAALVGAARYAVLVEVIVGLALVRQLRRRTIGSGAWPIV